MYYEIKKDLHQEKLLNLIDYSYLFNKLVIDDILWIDIIYTVLSYHNFIISAIFNFNIKLWQLNLNKLRITFTMFVLKTDLFYVYFCKTQEIKLLFTLT